MRGWIAGRSRRAAWIVPGAVVLATAALAAPASGQEAAPVREEIVLRVGASLGRIEPRTPGGGSFLIEPIVRPVLNKYGFGPAVDFPWFWTDVLDGAETYPSAGSLRLRPLLGGVAWTYGRGPVTFDIAGLGGYSFNAFEAKARDARSWYRGRLVLPGVVDVDNGPVWEARGSFFVDVRPPFAVMIGAAYLRARPHVTLQDGTTHQWRTDRITAQVGLAYTFRWRLPD